MGYSIRNPERKEFMRALIQRVSRACVTIVDDTPPQDPDPTRSIGRGFAILLGA